MIYQKKTIKTTKWADRGWFVLAAFSAVSLFYLANRALTLAGY